MSPEWVRALLTRVASGQLDVETAVSDLAQLPYEDLGFARLDHHRRLRTGLPEAVWGEHKTPEHIAGIVERHAEKSMLCVVTRVEADKAEAVLQILGAAAQSVTRYEAEPKLLVSGSPLSARGRGPVAVVAAGTSDLPIAEEASRTLELFGMTVERITDVGVSGLHRILSVRDRIEACEVAIVVAGMEGALPAVVKGLVSRPVIGVPTSVGTGAALDGLTPMLGMLTACAPGMTVVNVDNGFGGGYAAAVMNLDRSELRS